MTAPNKIPCLEYVGFWPRTAAAGVDSALLAAIITPALLKLYGADYLLAVATRGIAGPADVLLNWLFPAVAVIAFWHYKSATPGKMLIGARIVDADDGGPPSRRQLLIRYVGYYLSTIAFGLGLVSIAFDPRKQGWHDKLARTIVVREFRPTPTRAAPDPRHWTADAP